LGGRKFQKTGRLKEETFKGLDLNMECLLGPSQRVVEDGERISVLLRTWTGWGRRSRQESN